MKQYRFAFYTTEKHRSKFWGTVLSVGARAHGDVIDMFPKFGYEKPLDSYDGGATIGLSYSTGRLMNDHVDAGKHFLFFDKGYFNREVYWRVSVDAWQPLSYFQRFMRAPDRFEELGIPIKDFNKGSNEAPIVLAGACQNYSNFYNLGNVNNYNAMILEQLRRNTHRPLVYRPNPSWYTKHYNEFRPIHELVDNTTLSTGGLFTDVLSDCHLVVSHGTSAGVTSVLEGVPSMVLGEGIAKPVSMGPMWSDINVPYWPSDKARTQFFHDLAYCQWSIEEYKSGLAWEEIRLILSSLENVRADPQLESVLSQYKMMHKSPKYFRGVNTVNYRSEIGSIIRKTGSHTLLDFGSGKGEQYKHPYYLSLTWMLDEVVCYDPGVPELSELPNKQFDGVICCDVMEHVPESAVDDTLKVIFSKAVKFVFFVITTAPAKKNLPDGRNCHVTVKPEEWWKERIAPYCTKGLYVRVITKGEDNEG